MFQYDGVSRGESGHDGVHRREVRIVPRSEHEHDAERVALYESFKAWLRFERDGCESLRRESQHLPGPFFESADLSGRIGDGATHLMCELTRERITLGDEGIDGLSEECRSSLEWRGAPLTLRGAGAIENAVDRSRVGERPLDVELSVDRRDAAKRAGFRGHVGRGSLGNRAA